MNGKFMNGLERIIELSRDIGRSIKKNGKRALITVSLPFMLNNNINAGALVTYCRSSLSTPYIVIQHKSGATEDYGSYDALFLEVWPPTLEIYSKTLSPPPEDRLMNDARPPESMTTVNAEISGRGLSVPENAELEFKWGISSGIGNFSWKNIIGELSQRVDDGEGGYKYALIGNYDIKNMVNSARTIPISINNGITQGDEFFPSHKLDYYFFNHADLNRDRKVNGLDYAIWARNFGREDPDTLGSNVGKEPNDLDAYSDIDRSGAVDYNDLSLFSGEWLWDANDPNTWSRVR